ncbi:MAG: RNA polymerase sigma factor [Patescibacteria group bacterium]
MFKFQEKILLNQIKSGNQQAFAKIYDFYLDKIYRFIYFRVSDENLARDFTSETFIKVLNYIKGGQEIENFQSFLYQTARNLIVDFYRQKRQEELPIDEFIEENIVEEKDLASEVADKFELEKIQNALKQIPDHYREVIVLRFIEDLPFKEIAKIIGLKEDHTRVLVHRGLKMLRQQLSGHNYS